MNVDNLNPFLTGDKNWVFSFFISLCCSESLSICNQQVLLSKPMIAKLKCRRKREGRVERGVYATNRVCIWTKIVILPPAMAVFVPTVRVTAVAEINILPTVRTIHTITNNSQQHAVLLCTQTQRHMHAHRKNSFKVEHIHRHAFTFAYRRYRREKGSTIYLFSHILDLSFVW